MNKEEQQYLDLLQDILDNGVDKSDRTGVGTKSVFGKTMRFSLENNILPLLTTKKVWFKGIVEELLMFIRGTTDTKQLEAKGVKIWKGNTSREFLDGIGLENLPEGNLGKSYPYQWRNFGGKESPINFKPDFRNSGFDQLKYVLDEIKNNPTSRRIVLSAWNPLQMNEMALPPCHCFTEFEVHNGELSCLFFMRSNDFLLGNPYNIASYALLTHILAKASGLKAKELVYMAGDVHLYSNHIDAAKLQLSRTPHPFPQVVIKKELETLENIEALQFEDFELINYISEPAIKAEMAV